MTEHRLKTDTIHFIQQLIGVKNCELRRDDRHFSIGDTLILVEYQHGKPTGRQHSCVVTGCLYGYEGLKNGYCLLYTKSITCMNG